MDCAVCGEEIDSNDPHAKVKTIPQNLDMGAFWAYFCQPCSAQAALGAPNLSVVYEDWMDKSTQNPTEPTHARQD